MSMPEMNPVHSSNVESIGYDEENEIVYVRFLKDGSLYIYKGVSKPEYENLLYSTSIGSYINRNFKNVYPYERIE